MKDEERSSHSGQRATTGQRMRHRRGPVDVGSSSSRAAGFATGLCSLVILGVCLSAVAASDELPSTAASMGCYRFSADIFGTPSGGGSGSQAFDLAIGGRTHPCIDACFQRGFPFSVGHRPGDAVGPVVRCICGHDINTAYLNSSCPNGNASLTNVNLRKPDLGGNLTWATGLVSNISCYTIEIVSQRFRFDWYRQWATGGETFTTRGTTRTRVAAQSDAGLYYCLARYRLPTETGRDASRAIRSDRATLTVIDPPSVEIQEPSDNLHRVLGGSAVTFRCSVAGPGVLHTSWEKVGRGEGRRQHHFHRGPAFQLDAVTSADEGTYSCVGHREGLHIGIRDSLELLVVDPPKVTVGVANHLSIQGSRLTVNCTATVDGDLGRVALHWTRKDDICPPPMPALSLQSALLPSTSAPSGAGSVVQTLPLSFPVVAPTNGGRYTCVASSPQFTGCMPHRTVDITVVEPLLLTTRLSHRLAVQNSTEEVAIGCEIQTAISKRAPGHDLDVRWLRNGLYLTERPGSGHGSVRIVNAGRTVQIRFPSEDDAGSYRCLAKYTDMSNTQENWFASDEETLSVDVPPKAAVSPGGAYIETPLNADVVVSCRRARGKQSTTLSWLRAVGGMNLTLRTGSVGQAELALELPNFNLRDEGLYLCVAYDPSITLPAQRVSVVVVMIDVNENITATQSPGIGSGVNDAAEDTSPGSVNRSLLLLAGVFAGLFAVAIFLVFALLISRKLSQREQAKSAKGMASPKFPPASSDGRHRGGIAPDDHSSSFRYLPIVVRNALARRSNRSKKSINRPEKSPAHSLTRSTLSMESGSRARPRQHGSPRKAASYNDELEQNRHSRAFALLARRQNYEVPVDELFYEEHRIRSMKRDGTLSSADVTEVSSLGTLIRRQSNNAKPPNSAVTLLSRASLAPSDTYDDTVMANGGRKTTHRDPGEVYDDIIVSGKVERSNSQDWQSVDSFLSVTPDSRLRPPSPDYVHMSTILAPSVKARVDKAYWPENLNLPPTPNANSYLESTPPPLPADEATVPDCFSDSDSALNVPAWLKEEVRISSRSSDRSATKSRTPTPIGVRLPRQLRDDDRTYDIAEQKEGRSNLSMDSGEYDIPNHDTDHPDGFSFITPPMPSYADRPKQATPAQLGASGNDEENQPEPKKKRRLRLSLKRSPSKKSSHSVQALAATADNAQSGEVVKEASKAMGSLFWLIHSAAGLLTRTKSSRPEGGVSDATDLTMVSPGTVSVPRAEELMQRRKSFGGDSYDLPFAGGYSSQAVPEPSTLPKAASKRKSNGVSPAHYYHRLKFQMDQDVAAAMAQADAVKSCPPPEPGENAEDMVYSEPFRGEKYEAPPSNEAAIYQTLNNRRYRHIHPDHIRMKEEIGSGRFALVYRGLWNEGERRTDVAVKTLRQGVEKKDRVLFLQEAAITGQFKHKNIVQLYGVVAHEQTILLVFELMAGNLRNYLTKIAPMAGSSPDVNVQRRLRRMSMDVASGMLYLAERGFVHRDLAARNVMLDELCNCKVGDFGMSRILDESDYYVCHGGMIPVKWSAPEAINYRQFSSASDVWSYGILMHEIWTFGDKPYGPWTNEKVMKELKEGYRLPSPVHCPYELYCLATACWEEDKHERPTFAQIAHLLLEIDQVLRERENAAQVGPPAH